MVFKKGHTPWHKGKRGVYSKETIKKMSENRISKPMSKSTKIKISKRLKEIGHSPPSMKGKKFSVEHRIKMSESATGKNNHMYGKKQSKETIEKRVSKLRGIPRTQEVREKISKSNTGKQKSEEHRKRLSEVNRGGKCRFWKGGITALSKSIRTSYKYRQWRSDVFTRDEFICQDCGIHSGCGKTVLLEAHHIKPLSKILYENNIKSLNDCDDCDELWNINNGITYCTNCHIKNDKQRRRFNG